MNEVINFLGQWTWWIVAAVMFLLELAVTAFFFLWLGVAAILTAIIDMFVDLGWQSELASFAIFSVIALVASRYVFAKPQVTSDSPMLNRRNEALIGREFTLEEPMRNGRG
ncbi:MAG TPA: NfeD family protein, partial [Rhizobiales bacterium]|nr:NfeD family protein [Hyphomicrobiales bacterium]